MERRNFLILSGATLIANLMPAHWVCAQSSEKYVKGISDSFRVIQQINYTTEEGDWIFTLTQNLRTMKFHNFLCGPKTNSNTGTPIKYYEY